MTDDETTYLSGQAEYANAVTIPSGHYPATLQGVSETTHDLYGERWRWHYVIPGAHPDGGDFKLTVWTPPRISASGIANLMAAALGQPYRKGQAFSFDAARGRQIQLYVELDEAEGRNKVKTAAPAPQTPAPQAPAATPSNGAPFSVDPDWAAYQVFLAAKAAAKPAADIADDDLPF